MLEIQYCVPIINAIGSNPKWIIIDLQISHWNFTKAIEVTIQQRMSWQATIVSWFVRFHTTNHLCLLNTLMQRIIAASLNFLQSPKNRLTELATANLSRGCSHREKYCQSFRTYIASEMRSESIVETLVPVLYNWDLKYRTFTFPKLTSNLHPIGVKSNIKTS